MASARCALVMMSEDSRSAMVEASLMMRWMTRPERWRRDAAVERKSFSANQRSIYVSISAAVISALVCRLAAVW